MWVFCQVKSAITIKMFPDKKILSYDISGYIWLWNLCLHFARRLGCCMHLQYLFLYNLSKNFFQSIICNFSNPTFYTKECLPKKQIAEKETLVHMGGRGIKKSPFFGYRVFINSPLEKFNLSLLPEGGRESVNNFLCPYSSCPI